MGFTTGEILAVRDERTAGAVFSDRRGRADEAATAARLNRLLIVRSRWYESTVRTYTARWGMGLYMMSAWTADNVQCDILLIALM